MFASKCGKGAAELIEPGRRWSPGEKSQQDGKKKMAAWSWQSHAYLTCNFNHLTSFDHLVIFTASTQDIRDIGWLVSLELDSCKMHQNGNFPPKSVQECKKARIMSRFCPGLFSRPIAQQMYESHWGAFVPGHSVIRGPNMWWNSNPCWCKEMRETWNQFVYLNGGKIFNWAKGWSCSICLV